MSRSRTACSRQGGDIARVARCRDRSREGSPQGNLVELEQGIQRVRRVGDDGRSGRDPCVGGTRRAKTEGGQEVGVVVPCPGRGEIVIRSREARE